MTGGERGRSLGLLALLVALAAFVGARFTLTTDLTAFLPDPEDRALAALSREILDSDLSRTMVLAIEASDARRAAAASRRFERALRADPRVTRTLAFLEGGPRPELERASYALFASRRLMFLAATPEAARRKLDAAGLGEAARTLRTRLAGPLSPLVGRLAPEDPLLVLPTLIERIRGPRGRGLSVVDGRFLAEDGRTAVLFLGTRHSAFDDAVQAALLEAIDEAFDAVASAGDAPLELRRSGVNRYAVRAASAIRSDIRRVSIASTIVLGLGLLYVFRSVRVVGVAILPVVSGLIAGCAASLFFFGRIHGVTVAFGAALISVSIDYVAHLYCHDAVVAPEGGIRSSVRTLGLPLATACLTTIAGFSALAASPLGGLREIGTFAIAGIAVAFLATSVFVPVGLEPFGPKPDARRRVALDGWHAFVESTLAGLRRRRRLLALVLVGLLGLVAFGLTRVEWQTDLSRMSRLDADIRAEDEAVRAKVARFEQMRFVVASGSDAEEALSINEAVAVALEQAVEEGEIGGFSNLMPLLPSRATQAAVARVAYEDPDLPRRFTEVFGSAGFRTDRFEPFLSSLSAEPPPPLGFEELLESPLAGLVRAFRVPLSERVVVVSFLESVRDVGALRARIARIPGAQLIEQAALMRDATLTYQRSTRNALAVGLVAVLLVLSLRYRDLRRVLAAFTPPALAVATTLAVLAFAGRGVDLISLTSLLFVGCLGVDYGVLLVDASSDPTRRGLAAAVLGATIASGSTVFAFGLLGLSDHPVLANLGFTTSVGVATSFLLAPVALVVSGRVGPEGAA